MGFDAVVVLLIILIMMIFLIKEWGRPELIVTFALAAMLIMGIIEPRDALKGFSNEGIITIALLFIVAGAVQQSGMMRFLLKHVLGHASRPSWLTARLMMSVSALSAFLSNTPLVAMLAGEIEKWARERRIAPSKLLIPLSYASIFGGIITLIGTSTNLVVHGLLLQYGMSGFTMFDLAVYGVPCAIAGILYMSLIGHRSLPKHLSVKRESNEPHLEYQAAATISNVTNVSIAAGKGYATGVIIVVMMMLSAFNILTMLQSAILAIIALLVLRIIPIRFVHRYLQLDVILLIASAFGIGIALEKTGGAAWIAEQVVNVTNGAPAIVPILSIYLITNLFTEVMTNAATAVLMIPIAIAAADQAGVDPMAYVCAVTIASSAAFATPIGYQTNLLVYRPGRYTFLDFLKAGLPLNIIYMSITISIIYLFYL